MKSLKKISTVLSIALLTFSLTGCSTSSNNSPSASSNSSTSKQSQILYSNLTDDNSQKEVVSLLQAHGVSQLQTDTFLAWTDDFNSRITSPNLPTGFVSMTDDFVDYSSLLFDYKQLPDGNIFPEVNCRFTSFLLMQDHIQTNGTGNENDTYLMFDIEAIDTQKGYQLSPENRSKFITLFNSLPVAPNSTQEEHIAKIEEAWKTRGIAVDSTTGLSLIEVYLHSTFDDVRFVGHTGILVETENGLLFVEKFGPNAPFQATKFQSREELATYLLARPDLYGDQTELPPIVMENGILMDSSK
ncbi:MAG: DUF4300 family protein [Clostridiales bacterium]|nr:DUF4300 family protein [Clostridiales bacterium]